MKLNSILILVPLACFCACKVKEYPISKNQTFGRYKRQTASATEFLCLKTDMTYSYSVQKNDEVEIKTLSGWKFESDNSDSRIFIEKFDYSVELSKYLSPTGISAPILFSEAKNAIVIRMDPDDHFRDFIRVDTLVCD